MYKAADKAMGDHLTKTRAADKIAADMKLMRELFLDAVGLAPESSGGANDDAEGSSLAGLETSIGVHLPKHASLPRRSSREVGSHLDGAPRLSAEVGELLQLIETMKGTEQLAPLVARIEKMDSATLLSSAQLLGELMCQANLALAQQTVRSWKANLRADAGMVEDRSVGAVAGTPTFMAAFDALLEKGCSAADIRHAILNQHVELVLTAHPTEAQRRTIIKKHQRIVELLGEHDKHQVLTPGEIADLKSQIRSEQLAAWRTSNVRRSKPSAEGEARNGMMVIEETCWDAIPDHYRRVDRALARLGEHPLPYDATIMRISTWMGGDRDGNPNVTSQVTRRVNTLMRARAAELYYREVEKLLFELSHTGPISDEMRAEVEKFTGTHDPDGVRRKVFTEDRDYGVHWTFQTGCPDDEPYRVLLMAIRRRLYKTRVRMEQLYLALSHNDVAKEPESDADVYVNSADLLAPLELMYRSLIAVGDGVLADGTLLSLIRRVRTFGISMAKLDLRQESDRHAEVLDAITKFLGLGSYLQWDEVGRR